MKAILDSMPTFNKAKATSEDMYFIASQLVVKFTTINGIKEHKAEISETFGNYKEILSRCKELIKTAWDGHKKAVLSTFTYKAVLEKAWEIAKTDAKFSALCDHAEKNGIFVNAEDFISRFYPYINESGTPLVRQSYTDGWYKWTEYHERPINKFTDSFALSAMKATIRYYYDSIRNNATNRKSRINVTACDVPLNIKMVDESDKRDINLDVALDEIAKAKAEGRVLTLREYNDSLKK